MFLGVGAGMPKGVHSSVRRTIPDITPTIGSLLHFPTPFATGKSMAEILTGVEGQSRTELIPTIAHLSQNYPNPFNPTTTIEFRVSSSEFVSLQVFDVLGREVAMLVNEARSEGVNTVRWDASSQPSGVYYYRLQAGAFVESKKMILMR